MTKRESTSQKNVAPYADTIWGNLTDFMEGCLVIWMWTHALTLCGLFQGHPGGQAVFSGMVGSVTAK